jgi:DNA-binding LacI/PurR family transcriptional regulator
VGVVLSKITSSFFPQVLKGIEDVAYQEGYSLMFYDSSSDAAREEKYVRLLYEYGVEGLIIDSIASFEDGSEYRQFVERRLLNERGMPVISIERLPWKDSLVSAVGIDNREGGYLATRHLVELGHREILHLAGPENFPVANDRIHGYRRALEEAGIAYEQARVIRGDFSPMSGYAALKDRLLRGRDFTAVFAANDQMGIGAIKALKEQAIGIPKDVAIVGFDNLPVSSLIEPPLSTVDVPKYQLGKRAMEILVHQLRSNSVEHIVENAPIRLIPRRSTSRDAVTSWELFGW